MLLAGSTCFGSLIPHTPPSSKTTNRLTGVCVFVCQCLGQVVGSKQSSGRAHPPPVRLQTHGLHCPQTDGGKTQDVS